jgi:CRISPR-associated exonuclease Cas4
MITEYTEDDYLALSGIQHFFFCRRQWALIHIEQQWHENILTVEGKILHERTHDPFFDEKRKDTIITRALSVCSRHLGIYGVCDVVEFHKNADGISLAGRQGTYKPIPVEYKRGKPKSDEVDMLQLCLQAMCLEEMLSCKIEEGYLYYGETRHREKVEFTDELRQKVCDMTKEMHMLYERRYTPKVKVNKSGNRKGFHQKRKRRSHNR